MTLLLAALPIIVVVLLLSLKVPTLRAVLITLALTAVLSLIWFPITMGDFKDLGPALGETILIVVVIIIGGTSLFGGRGSAYSALLGIIVIQAISNGLTLLNLSSSLRYMITGAVLAIAVIVDSLARRSRATHGRG